MTDFNCIFVLSPALCHLNGELCSCSVCNTLYIPTAIWQKNGFSHRLANPRLFMAFEAHEREVQPQLVGLQRQQQPRLPRAQQQLCQNRVEMQLFEDARSKQMSAIQKEKKKNWTFQPKKGISLLVSPRILAKSFVSVTRIKKKKSRVLWRNFKGATTPKATYIYWHSKEKFIEENF